MFWFGVVVNGPKIYYETNTHAVQIYNIFSKVTLNIKIFNNKLLTQKASEFKFKYFETS